MKLDLQFFGGRGSDSGGWDAPSDDKPTPPITDRKSLISERGAKEKEVDQVLTTLKNMTDEYGVRVEDVDVVTFGKGGGNIMGVCTSDGDIGISKNFFYEGRMNSAWDKCVETGYHPSRGNKSGLEATAAHEYGHAIMRNVAGGFGKNYTDLCNKITQEAGKATGHNKFMDLASKVSGYAKESSSECIAEAFADVYCNGNKASKESQAVVNVAKKYL